MISSGATYDFVKIIFSLVVPRQVSPIWLKRCCLLGSCVGALLLLESFFACVKVRLQHRRTLCLYPIMDTAHTYHCVITKLAPCHWNLDASCAARFERLTNVLKPYVSAGEHHDSDNASDPVCTMAQVDIWPLIHTREQRGCCVVTHMLVASSTKEMQDGTRFIAQPLTPNGKQFHLALVEISTNV